MFVESTSKQPGPVLISLQALQHRFGYVHDDAVELVALACNVSRAEVHGVLTFYHDLRRTPAPEHLIKICVAEACQAVGSRQLVSEVEVKFNNEIGKVQTNIEVQEVFCFGNCALGPTSEVDGKLVGRSTLEKIRACVERPDNS